MTIEKMLKKADEYVALRNKATPGLWNTDCKDNYKHWVLAVAAPEMVDLIEEMAKQIKSLQAELEKREAVTNDH
ncbi:MAG: hypothetical protein JRI27_10990 [Deltaproteobacteria bacterium]|nr:hypothetical protein [Deltaproteobacteria bacterium]